MPSAEAYRPCTTAAGECAELPAGLERFDGPYPVVIVMHGVIADKVQHRFNTQTFAENGYLAVGVERHRRGQLRRRRDPAGRDRGKGAYLDSQARDMDYLHITMRDTVHTDWNGRGTGLAGNRLFEQASNYYNVAWLDLHLKGKLGTDEAGAVVTQDGRTESAERAYRQEQAQWAFGRLTSKAFLPGTIDKHNISLGSYDPEKAEQSGDPLWGGNVPYLVEGTWAIERLSPFSRSYCSLSVTDSVGGSSGAPGSPDGARADSGADGDMRLTGCVPAGLPNSGKDKKNKDKPKGRP